MKYSKYVLLRRIISSSVLLFITLGFWGICENAFLALSKLQFGQIFLDVSIGSAIVCFSIILVSFIFGRIYCSTLCPLGTMQDISGALGKSLSRKKYSFHRNTTLYRCLVFIFVVSLYVLGVSTLIGLIDPYSIYVRGASQLLDRIIGFASDLMSPLLKDFGVYLSYSPGSFYIIPVLVLALILLAAFFRGRLFCNTICPVGMILGCVSQAQLIRPVFKDNCVSCGKCESVCKGECISVAHKWIASHRCVMCGNCAAACPVEALEFARRGTKNNYEKRRTIKGIFSLALFTALPFLKGKNYFWNSPTSLVSELSNKIKESGSHPQIPAGAMSWARLRDKCLGCHACIKRCPSKVLEPAPIKYGIHGITKPVISFDKGFCQYDCIECGQTCPFGAIMPISVDEKHKIQTGIAEYTPELCVIITNGEQCGACAEHCPTGALEIIYDADRGMPIPTINSKLCVGCGACEYICPIIPQKAIIILPHSIHQAAEVLQAQDNNVEEVLDDFKFKF